MSVSGRALLVVLLLAVPVAADTTNMLRAKLSQFAGRETVAASLEVQLWSRSTGFGDGRPEQGKALVNARSGPTGIEFHYPAPDLIRAETEEKKNRLDPELKTPTISAIRELDALEVRDLLNFAPTLLGYLQRGTIRTEKTENYGGRPARKVTIDVDPPLPQSMRRRLRDVHYVVNLWVAGDGTPLGAEASLHGKARFLVVNFEHTQEQRWTFAPRGDRLVVTSHSDHVIGSGFGNRYEKKLNVAVRVQ
jgi:hypothetical protein